MADETLGITDVRTCQSRNQILCETQYLQFCTLTVVMQFIRLRASDNH